MGKTALVVDDCTMSRMVTRHVLASAGYHVLEAEDGNGALSVLSALDKAPIDLLVSDYNMPGMNGAALIRAMRRLPACSGIPMFILSSEGSVESQQDGLAAGATAWLAKPLSPVQMLSLLAA